MTTGGITRPTREMLAGKALSRTALRPGMSTSTNSLKFLPSVPFLSSAIGTAHTSLLLSSSLHTTRAPRSLYVGIVAAQPQNLTRFDEEKKKTEVAPDPKLDVDTSASLYIAEQPPVPVEGFTAICYGAGGDVRGHPVQYIQLNRTKMDQPGTCKYCGLRFIHKGGLEAYNKTFATRQPDHSCIAPPKQPLWKDPFEAERTMPGSMYKLH